MEKIWLIVPILSTSKKENHHHQTKTKKKPNKNKQQQQNSKVPKQMLQDCWCQRPLTSEKLNGKYSFKSVLDKTTCAYQ